MKLSELNILAREATDCERQAKCRQRWSADIGGVRKTDRTLAKALEFLKQYAGPDDPKVRALLNAEVLLRDDLLRVAEMDLDAQARGLFAKAAAKRAAIAVYCGEKTPVVGEGVAS